MKQICVFLEHVCKLCRGECCGCSGKHGCAPQLSRIEVMKQIGVFLERVLSLFCLECVLGLICLECALGLFCKRGVLCLLCLERVPGLF